MTPPPEFWRQFRAAVAKLGGPATVAQLSGHPEQKVRFYVAGVVPPIDVLAVVDRFADSDLTVAIYGSQLVDLDQLLVRKPGGRERPPIDGPGFRAEANRGPVAITRRGAR